MNLADLKKPFPPDRLSWRVGAMTQDKTKGMALAYIDARDVMGRLDEVAGADWQCEYVPMPNGTCCCRIGLKIGGEWVWRSNGALNISDSEKPDAKEMAEKGSYSDAFKRAAVLWGVGQYLYDLDSPWVALDDKKRIVPSEYPKLRALLGGAVMPTTAQTAPAPKSQAQYDDNDGQMKAYLDQQKGFISACKTQEDVQGWVEQRQPELDRLKRKDLKAWNELRNFKEDHIKKINKEAA